MVIALIRLILLWHDDYSMLQIDKYLSRNVLSARIEILLH